MLTIKQTIQNRRSIRNFKPDDIPEDIIMDLIDSARLAPSSCNSQPWRFKIVKDQETKNKLAEFSHNQIFVAKAPAVLVCCADVKRYINGTITNVKVFERIGALKKDIADILLDNGHKMKEMDLNQLYAKMAFNVAIAVEHIVLAALEYNLGSCWVRLFDENKIKQLFGWDDNIHVVALLPMGYAKEEVMARKRRKLEELLIN